MAGIGRLQNKILPEEKIASEGNIPESQRTPENSSIKKQAITLPPHLIPLPKSKSSSSPTTPAEKTAQAKDKLYQQILAESLEERLSQQKFMARVEGKSTPKEESKTKTSPQGKVVFQPVPQKSSKTQKIIVRILIVLLIASLGLLLYLILQGYLI